MINYSLSHRSVNADFKKQDIKASALPVQAHPLDQEQSLPCPDT